MVLKKNWKHPSFLIGLLSYILLLVGAILQGSVYHSGYYVIIASVILGAIHWVWSIVDVAGSKHIDSRSRPFWLALVIIVAPLGGMIYYAMKSKNVAM